MLRPIKFSFKKNKRGVSIMVGYVLLISLAVVMGTITYQWVKTYVPKDDIKCPDGVSLFVEDIQCNVLGLDRSLDLTLKNNGRFNVDGYFIKVTNNETQELATIDISTMATLAVSGGGIVLFPGPTGLKTGDKYSESFNLTSFSSTIYLVEILPAKVIEADNKKVTASCSAASIKEKLTC